MAMCPLMPRGTEHPVASHLKIAREGRGGGAESGSTLPPNIHSGLNVRPLVRKMSAFHAVPPDSGSFYLNFDRRAPYLDWLSGILDRHGQRLQELSESAAGPPGRNKFQGGLIKSVPPY